MAMTKLSTLVFALSLLAGCASKPCFEEETMRMQQAPAPYRLQAGDCILVPDPAGTNGTFVEAQLDSAGFVDLPRLGRLYLLGMSELEAEDMFCEACRLRGIRSWAWPPQRTSSVFYRVTGEVVAPGCQPYLGRTTLTRAIAAAGGFTATARRSRLVIRRDSGSLEYYNYSRILKSPSSDPEVRPGDSIEVKRRSAW
jgi:protein involved in polysaccharide export with SLBB domain